jgi:hypothetical protein
MAGPWEQYQAPAAAPAGPWNQYAEPAPAPEAAPTPSEVPGPRGQPPAWAKDYPELYQGARTAREVLGPTVEVLGAVGGTVVGAPAGPAGAVLGSATGYGAASGLLRQADIALGNIPDMTPAEGITAGTRDLLVGAIYEAGGRVAAPYIDKALQMGGRGVGWLYDTLSGQLGTQKAAKILRDSLGVDVGAARRLARQGGSELTAAQSIADLASPTTQALLAKYAKRDPRFQLITEDLEEAARINQLAELAGAETQAGAKTAQKEAKKELRNRLLPELEQAMYNANLAGELGPRLQAQAERMGQVATAKADQVRRLSAVPPTVMVEGRPYNPSAPTREPVVGLVPPPEAAVPAGTRLLEKGQQKSIELGRPVSTGRYTYEGELAERADRVAAEAAEGSLIFGEASRFATAAEQSLAAHGYKPLKTDQVVANIDKILTDVKLAPGARDLTRLLTMAKNDILKWTNAGGVIDAYAYETLRKNLGANARKLAPNDPTAQKELAAKVTASVGPMIRKAIEEAGGTGYGAYLDAYSAGLKAVSEKKMSAKALELYQTDPSTFVKLVEGNNTKAVEKIFGSGSYDVAKEMSEVAMSRLTKLADEVKRDKRIIKQVEMGHDALVELLDANKSRFRFPDFAFNRATTAGNTTLDELSRRLGKKVMDKLTEASKSGKNMAQLIDTLPAAERTTVLRVFSNPQEWMVIPKEARGATVNLLAPENRNELRK